MVRDQDEFGGDDLSLRLLLGQRALSRQGLHDTLTDLPDRALLTERFERTLAGGARAGHPVAVAFLNLDQFEQINASLGDAAGDVVLVEVAERLALQLRDGEILARFAGGEFVAVWCNLESAEDTNQFTERLAEAFEAPFLTAGAEVLVSARIGVGVAQRDQNADEMRLAAAVAMNDAKRRGLGKCRSSLQSCASGRSR
jgi:diguanylate cyclase (GGDEF)-like protein